MVMQDASKLWKTYMATKDPGLREYLIMDYAPLVKIIAGRLSIHLGQYVDYEDIISYGVFGLIDAIDKFDPGKGIKFETYASIRIRGAIIDNIRKLDWVPRSLRAKNKKLEQVYAELTIALGHEPTTEDVAEKLQMTVAEARELMSKSSVASLVSLDDYLEQNHDISSQAAGAPSLDKDLEEKEVKKMLQDAIEMLGEKEKKVIILYYYEEMTLKEISKVLGVSESRISQIHSKAVLSLQSKLGKFKSILFY